ncbi:PH domain-containing protein [Staphylococcus equorum]|uniref:PH domain-containing protein n=1 Tax=Staphylococcus equorum TaxID=246432 RepID=A0A9X4LCR2_9STAP|nr:PH domain-containing protein [Staphylococcus equorum]MDG0843916.1 PH domain-containing protein [Staphylococcus equorum]MDG0860207.1 PH domain-containing protein [Staphylococcus equorum]
MYSPQKLHPISYLTGIIEAIKQNIFLIIIFLVFNIQDFDFTSITSYIFPAIVFAFFLFSFVAQVLKVYNTTYWIENDHFVLATGIFTKERKELNIRRIQTLDTSQGIINQIVGGVKLQIKTPSDGIDLDTVSKKQSELIQRTIKEKQQELTSQNEERDLTRTPSQEDKEDIQEQVSQPVRLYKLNFKELLFMALTSGAIGVAFAAISPIIGAFSEVIPWEWLTGEFARISQAIFVIMLIMIAAIVIASYILGTLIVIIKNYNYTVTQNENQLNIRYGLFNVKSITVPTDRVQAVVEKQSFLRKLFGFTSIHFVITSDMNGNDKDDISLDGNVMILPFIKRKKAFEIIKSLIPSMTFEDAEQGMPWRGFHRHFWRETVVLLVIATIVTYFWTPWSFLIATVMILLLIIHSYIVIKSSGLKVQNDELVVRNVTTFGFKNTYFKHDKILGMEIKRNPFLINSDLGNFNFIIAKAAGSEAVGLKFNNYKEVETLQNWYLRSEHHE